MWSGQTGKCRKMDSIRPQFVPMSGIILTRWRDVVYVIYTDNYKRFRVSTSVIVEDQYWDKDHVRKNHPDYENVDKQVKVSPNRVVTASLAVSSRGSEPTAERVHTEYEKLATPSSCVLREFW